MNFVGIFSLLLFFTQQFYPLPGLVTLRSPCQRRKFRGFLHYRNEIISREAAPIHGAVLPSKLVLKMSVNQDISREGEEKAAKPDASAG
jgi:hypothetical protein